MQNRHWTRKWATRWPTFRAAVFGKCAPAAHGGGELGELAGGVGGDGGGGFFGAEFFGVGEDPFEELAGFWLDELVDADAARFVPGSR